MSLVVGRIEANYCGIISDPYSIDIFKNIFRVLRKIELKIYKADLNTYDYGF